MASDFENQLLARVAALEKYIDDLKGLDRPGSSLFGAGRIPFADADGTLTSNALLIYDPTNGRVGIGISNPASPLQVVGAIRSNSTATPAGGAIIQGIVDADNSFARAFMGHNAVWDIVSNLWNIDNVGANDAQGWLTENNGGVRFIYHASAGAAARTMTHTVFMAGNRFRVQPSAGNTGIWQNAIGAGTVNDYAFSRDDLLRWVIRSDGTNDNLAFIARDNAGGLIGTVLTLDRLALTAAINQEGWTTPTLGASWTNYGAPFATVGYMKDSLGFVHLRGLIRNGTVGSTAFTLAAGYRPVASHLFAVLSNNAIGRIEIASGGTVVPAAPSSNAWVSLDGISFATS